MSDRDFVFRVFPRKDGEDGREVGPYRSLLMWAVLMNLPDLARNIWEEGEGRGFGSMSALTVAHLCRWRAQS